jgi:predicted RNA-binding Zn-ribbon protein involved in translation (DUF1610 family)
MKQLIILMLLIFCSSAIFAQTSEQPKQKKEHTKTSKVMYRCPTHPEVVSSKPGVCAKCGNKLVVQRQGSKQMASVTYSCPMHPNVVSNEPGKCPKCGKDLEKQQSSEKKE